MVIYEYQLDGTKAQYAAIDGSPSFRVKVVEN